MFGDLVLGAEWKTYDINMSNWKYIDQKRILKTLFQLQRKKQS